MLKPISLNCGHSGCKKCFEEMTTSTNSLKCPICRTEFNAQTLSVNVALDNITRDLPVRCLSSGCSWRGSYEDAQQHQRDCPKLEIECENEGCQHVFAREEMATHAASCQKKKIHCPDCRVGVTSDSLLAHQTSRCYHAVTQCPLNCGKTLPRWVFYSVVHKIFCALRGSFISCSLQCWVTTSRGRRHSCLWFSLECYTRDLLCHNICVISPWWPLV